MHKIKRQVLEITLPPEREAGPTQERLRQLFHQRLLPEVEKAWDQLSPAGTLHRLDRLTLDLGEVRLDHLEADLTEALRRSLAEHMPLALQRAGGSHPRSASPQQTSNGSQTVFELLTCYAQTGLLPWWADQQQGDPLAQAVATLEPGAVPVAAWRELLRQPRVRRRLSRSLSSATLATLLEGAFPQAEQAVLLWTQRALPLMANGRKPLPRALLTTWHEMAMQALLQGDSPSKLIQSSWASIARQVPAEQLNEVQSDFRQVLAWVFEARAEEISLELAEDSLAPPGTPEAPSRLDRPAQDRTAKAMAREGITVSQAGLVLLSPYLAGFFKQLDYWGKGGYANPEAPERMAALLQYLATGQRFAPEYQQPLLKVLAGLPLDHLSEWEGEPSEAETTAADTLLEAVLLHAPGLGLHSIDGLRGSFLLREGILRQTPQAWTLHVQTEPYDLVLKQLPWTFQVVKLPWMPQPLFVSW